MKEVIQNLANNNTVIIGLTVLLGILIVLFLIVLFCGKGKKDKKEETVEEINIPEETPSDNIDFDHGEYVKETTAEFELTPITDVQPTPDGFVPDVSVEESPAIDLNSKNNDELPLAEFDFDELSKAISIELEKLKAEENKKEEVKEPLLENGSIKPIEVTKYEEIKEFNLNPSDGIVLPELKDDKPKDNIVNEPVIKEEETPLFARFNQETYNIDNQD